MKRPRRATSDRKAAENRGRDGERRAAWWLWLRGWRILDRRVRTPAGEVDLVVRKGNLVAFVEVKTRATNAELDFAIDERRLRRVAAAAEYLSNEDHVDALCRAGRRHPRRRDPHCSSRAASPYRERLDGVT